ncbi:MAG: hypothetical protein EB127_12920 [Alphaproteobacteria bacterium]|nr:hypothetical protein [Alphaproteobacteria bacterium]
MASANESIFGFSIVLSGEPENDITNDEASDKSSIDESEPESESTGGHEDAAGTEEEWFDSGLGGGGNSGERVLDSKPDNDIENFDGDSDDGYEAVGGFDTLDGPETTGNTESLKIYSGDDNIDKADMSYMLTPNGTNAMNQSQSIQGQSIQGQSIQNVTNSILNPATSMISNPDIKIIDISSSFSTAGSPKAHVDENFDDYSKEDEFFEE